MPAYIDIETMIFGIRTLTSQMPFAGHKRFITVGFQCFGQSNIFFGQLPYVLGRKKLGMSSHLAPLFSTSFTNPIGYSVAGGKLACHNAGTGRTGHLTGCISLGKPHAITGDSIDIGRFIITAARTCQISPAKVISQNK